MSNWINAELGNFIELKRGYDLPKQQRSPGGVPIISSSGASGFHSTAQVKGPGVVTGRYGTLGQVFFIREDFWPLNTSLYVHDFKGNDPRFIGYFLRQLDFHAYSDKGAVPGLNRNHLHRAKVKMPGLPEQRAIAHVLGSLDDKIELNLRMSATLEDMAQTLFRSWFVNFDPVKAKKDGREPDGMDAETASLFPDTFYESEQGQIPKGWRMSTVGDVAADIFSGGTPDTRKPEYWNGSVPWFSSGETRNLFVTNTEKFITPDAVRNSSTRLARPNDILIASAGQGYTRGQTSYCTIETYINQSVVSVRANETECHSLWLFYNLSNRYEEMRSISDSHSSRGSLTTKLLAQMKLCIPPKPIIDLFAQGVGCLVKRQTANISNSSTLAALRDELLPKLISGELRLPDNIVAEFRETPS